MPTIVDKKVHDKANCSRLHELHVWSWSREFYGEYICKVCHMKFPAENYLRIHTGSKKVKRISDIKIGQNLTNLVKSRSSPFFSFFSSNFFFLTVSISFHFLYSKHLLFITILASLVIVFNRTLFSLAEQHAEQSNSCNICGKTFSGKRYLTMHIKVSFFFIWNIDMILLVSLYYFSMMPFFTFK